MAKDLLVDNNGDLIVDPVTHDLTIVDGIEEITQRIKATLEIRHGEMQHLDPEMGSDFKSVLGKHLDKESASADIQSAITSYVPEVESVLDITFKKLPRRALLIKFTAIVDAGSGIKDKIEGELEV